MIPLGTTLTQLRLSEVYDFLKIDLRRLVCAKHIYHCFTTGVVELLYCLCMLQRIPVICCTRKCERTTTELVHSINALKMLYWYCLRYIVLLDIFENTIVHVFVAWTELHRVAALRSIFAYACFAITYMSSFFTREGEKFFLLLVQIMWLVVTSLRFHQITDMTELLICTLFGVGNHVFSNPFASFGLLIMIFFRVSVISQLGISHIHVL